MSNSNSKEPLGIPIYSDPIDRRLPEAVETNDTDWHPASSATIALWRCFESLGKVKFQLTSKQPIDSVQLKRFLIAFTVPLDDFFICIKQLIHAIKLDENKPLSDEELRYVLELGKRFGGAVLSQIQPLRTVRNKLGAHTDAQISPNDATNWINTLDIHLVGSWFHAALLVLDKLTRLDCYAWSSKGYGDREIRLMTSEPIVLTLRDDDVTNELEMTGLFEMTESPKRHIHKAIADVAELSAWMFAKGQTRLVVTNRG